MLLAIQAVKEKIVEQEKANVSLRPESSCLIYPGSNFPVAVNETAKSLGWGFFQDRQGHALSEGGNLHHQSTSCRLHTLGGERHRDDRSGLRWTSDVLVWAAAYGCNMI